MTDKRFVAFFDILGFSKLVETSSVNDIKVIFHKIFSSILLAQHKYWCRNVFKLACSDSPEISGIFAQKLKEAVSLFEGDNQIMIKKQLDLYLTDAFRLGYLIISDSIIFYSEIIEDDSDAIDIFDQFVNFIRSFFIESFLKKILIRGAISYGEFHVDVENSIYFGKALIEAIRLEKNQQWIGCIFSDSLSGIIASYHIKKIPSSYKIRFANSFFHNKTIAKYKAPIKNGESLERYIVNWYGGVISKIELNDNFFSSHLTGDPSIDIKYFNTLEYMKWSHSRMQMILL